MESILSRFSGKTINVILLLMVFGICLGFNLITYDSCFIKITILQIGAALAFALWLVKLSEQKTLPPSGPGLPDRERAGFKRFLNLPLVIFFIWGLGSFLRSPYKGVGLEELIKLCAYVGIYFVVINNVRTEKQFARITYSLLLAGLIAVLYGFVQYLGLDPFIWKGAFNTRIFSTFGNPNFYGAYLVLITPLILTIFLRNRKYIFLVFFILVALSIVLTSSKGAWLAFGIEVVLFSVMAVLFLSHAQKKKVKLFLIILSTLIIVTSATGVIVLSQRRPDSVVFRLLTWRSTYRMIKLNPVLGNGLNSFRVIYPLYRDKMIFRIEGKHQTETQHPENEYIEIASDEGIMGLGIFLWMLATFYVYGIKKAARLKEQLEGMDSEKINKKTISAYSPAEYQLSFLVGLITGVTGLLIHSLFCVNMRFVSSGFFFWLVLGLIHIQIVGYPPDRYGAGTKTAIPYRYSLKIRRLLQLLILGLTAFLIVIFIRFYLGDMHHNRGIAYSKAKMWTEALQEYETVVKYNPYFTMGYYFIGNVYTDRWAEGDDQRALDKYDQVKELAPDYVMVHYQVGMVYDKLGQWDKAIENFNKAIKLDPVFPITYFKLGWDYAQIKKWPEAIEAYKKTVEVQPNFADAYINLGNIYFMVKDFKSSEETFKKANEITPQSFTLHRNLGLLYAYLKRYSEATEEWRKALTIDPSSQEVKNLMINMRDPHLLDDAR
jgi:tetratricopeptide (TPR) repeat protein/O-antigen ligase